jgi:iron complex outermembrane receptor protein
MIRQLWLDNDYFGNIFSLHFDNTKTQVTLGGGLYRYDGSHFGKIIWAKEGLTGVGNWYDHDARKDDVNIYLKQQAKFEDNWYWFYDLQYRFVNYAISGFRDNPTLNVNNDYHFFNPKVGISYEKNGWKAYASYSIANKEPNRDDFETGITQPPLPERLHDIETGIERTTSKYNWAATVYYMNYKNQLVLTGKINDVGAYTRTNIPNSFRTGVELQGGIKFNQWVNASANVAFSKNKVKNFAEYIDDYDNGGQKVNSFNSTDIAYSPAVVGGASINFLPFKNAELSLLSKYVSKQYLDNTEDDARSLNAFFVQDVRAIYTIKKKMPKEISIIAQVNNLFGRKYEPNGYTFSYIYGGDLITENYYFPMAGTNFMLGLNVKF